MKFERLTPEGDSAVITYTFDCPGCHAAHFVCVKNVPGGCAWHWNGDANKPTVTPSILVSAGSPEACHSFIVDGKIQFLGDCKHALAGQTVELPELSGTYFDRHMAY